MKMSCRPNATRSTYAIAFELGKACEEARQMGSEFSPKAFQSVFKKGSGTFAGTARRVLRTKVPDPFLNTLSGADGLAAALAGANAHAILERQNEDLAVANLSS